MSQEPKARLASMTLFYELMTAHQVGLRLDSFQRTLLLLFSFSIAH